MRKFDNDSGQVAVIFFFFITIGAIAFYFIVIGGMMDDMTVIHNNITQSGGVPLTQDRQDAMALTQGAFASIPIIAFVLTIILALVYAMANRYSTV